VVDELRTGSAGVVGEASTPNAERFRFLKRTRPGGKWSWPDGLKDAMVVMKRDMEDKNPYPSSR
jgi:hypothetical protein